MSEIGTSFYSDSAAWIELYNGTSQPIDLSEYSLRSFSSERIDPYRDDFTPKLYPLPKLTVQPGEYVMVAGRPTEATADSVTQGAKVIYVEDGNWIPNWYASGFVELVKGSSTADFVRFGDNDVEPLTPGAWTGSNVRALLTGENQMGKSLARDLKLTDTGTASDWTHMRWATPFGPNNIAPLAGDLDLDGLPDQAEAEGQKYGSFDLYALGARAGQRDLFIEIDYMPTEDQATTPQEAALDKVVEAFARRNIKIHFDIGDLYGDKYNLGGGNPLPYSECIDLFTSAEAREQGCVDVYAIKAQNHDPRRRQIFHYNVFGSSRVPGGERGSSGVGEINGNDFAVTVGNWSLDSETIARRNMLVNIQSSTLMHELGHNLGLRHGGFEDGPNYKPNYISTMNYAYQVGGVPLEPKRADAFEHWLWYSAAAPVRERYGLYTRCDIDNGPCSSNYLIDYSDGSSTPIDENHVNEHLGVGRGPVDMDWSLDGTIQSDVKADLTQDMDYSTGQAVPAPRYTVLRDFDDWSNLNLNFTRYWGGTNPGLSAQTVATQQINQYRFQQEVSHEHPLSEAEYEFLREAGY
ncbi:hypothetical protein ACFP81_12465 [Deinococcus lacus]|uniref:LTD domain-containing protein n=1 Tax=Deinococcus lacus TaxID=392561 RepID=A0ABW1YFE6_9DEIO